MKLAVVRIRGSLQLTHEVRDTLRMLNLGKPNHCVVLEDTPSVRGMLAKVSHVVTWGPVDANAEAEIKKRGEKVFRLNPPRKGYGRKGVKMPFTKGGALGDRAEKINDLLLRMV